MKNFICKILGHYYLLDDVKSTNVAGAMTCKRCGKHEPKIEWPHK